MHGRSQSIEMRLDRFVSERLEPALYGRRLPLTVRSWHAPGEPVPFDFARTQDFGPFEVGQSWGPPWGTTWFHVTGVVPAGWGSAERPVELVFDLGFSSTRPGFQAEATVYRADGSILKGLHPRNRYVRPAEPHGPVDLYLEAAANPDIADGFTFRPTPDGERSTAGTEHLYRFLGADIAELNTTVWELLQDVSTLRGLVDTLPAELPRRAIVLQALEDMLDVVDPFDVAASAAAGRAVLAEAMAQPAEASAHRVVAVGHAHIDSAWLWPKRETVRKCARTFSNVLDLMDADPDLVFACSSAQQYAWIRDSYPELFERIKARVADGRFVPVGGMWVEPDTNMPGGEALARQFIAGKRFFIEEFGKEPLDVWLPDSFGYSAALPQIAVAAGARWFLTQKMSWNEINAMPHHTFLWEGIDGSRLFTHFPPVDTYNAELSGEELSRAQAQHADKGRSNLSLVPFGWGNGGGGPTREMLAAARRSRSLEGSPQVRMDSPEEFFREAESDQLRPAVWSGELYLEFHRGTYTSQARTKRGNRRSEHLLHEAELWAATAHLYTGAAYPYDELERAWHVVLLQQFHDILPGSSIAWVHREAEERYAQVATDVERLIDTALHAFTVDGAPDLVFNAGPYPQAGVPALGAGAPESGGGARVVSADGQVVMQNDKVRAVVDDAGLLVSVWDLVMDREVLAPGSAGNLLQLHRDTPTQWDAWDIDEHYRRSVTDLRDIEVVQISEETTERVAVRIRRRFGSSTVDQVLSLSAGSAALDIETRLDWHERQHLLKLAFPLDVHADRAASEIQFGHIYRPTHANTSWDAARFETVAHRWVHVGETSYGVAVANDSTYGHDIARSTRDDGGTTTTVRLSLVRAPLFPDPEADQGEHVMRCSLLVNAGIGDAVREGYRLNLPLRTVRSARAVDPLVAVDHEAIVVETVKLAEDRSGDVVVRLYEAHGSRARGRLTPNFSYETVEEADLLERPLSSPCALGEGAEGELSLSMRPFRIVTLRFRRRGAAQLRARRRG